MNQEKERRVPGATGNAARYSQDTHKSEDTANTIPPQARFDPWLDHPTCRDRDREADGALLVERFAATPVDQWRSIGGAS